MNGKCSECGTEIDLHANDLCFTCDFYKRHVDTFTDLHVVVQREDGSRWGYKIGTVGLSSKPNRGFGGREFHIQFLDGRSITTNDLWCWGTGIPEHFYDRLPVNAKIMTTESVIRSLRSMVDSR